MPSPSASLQTTSPIVAGNNGTISEDNTNNAVRLQQKILLNASRCLLQLADLMNGKGDSSYYRKTSILACTTVISFNNFLLSLSPSSIEVEKETKEEDRVKMNAELNTKAWYLRSRAYLYTGKYDHAMLDAKQILKINSNSFLLINFAKEVLILTL